MKTVYKSTLDIYSAWQKVLSLTSSLLWFEPVLSVSSSFTTVDFFRAQLHTHWGLAVAWLVLSTLRLEADQAGPLWTMSTLMAVEREVVAIPSPPISWPKQVKQALASVQKGSVIHPEGQA